VSEKKGRCKGAEKHSWERERVRRRGGVKEQRSIDWRERVKRRD